MSRELFTKYAACETSAQIVQVQADYIAKCEKEQEEKRKEFNEEGIIGIFEYSSLQMILFL